MITAPHIIATVATVTGVPVAAITGRRRTRPVTWARFLSVAAIRQRISWWTLQQTGDSINRDHGSVLWAVRRHADLLETEPEYGRLWAEVQQDLTHQS